ncbi:restriction endonuclease subunit S [Imperialibacter roseus]|uniref:Restriction endonuclease subunit S n=1 Tax=Imperialibacter roseus TaxID=1324217 RepID=A0ABZ0IYZ6_9BACT|nr:restriction endonuclease subunit S [Imperialibacter roseus]WOK09359.1 restriction endonuclease subunit S [Imperialibacter roseus]
MGNNYQPTLRFPEFSGDWPTQALGYFIEERKEISDEELPLYSLTIEKGIVAKSERYERSHLVNDEGDAYKVMYENDFAFNPMNLRFGALARYKENSKVKVSKYYNIFYCNDNGNPIFFENYLTSFKLIQFYDRMSTGSLIEKKRVHYLDFVHFKRHIPSLPEQQKIASFLTAVDSKLQALKKKKALLEQYKKGLMQKLFSQELRFKDENGKEFPEWEKKKLGEVAKVYDGTHQTPNYVEEGVPFYSVEHVTANQFSETKFISEAVFIKENQRVELQKGDILMTRIGDIGTPRLIDWDVRASFYVSLALIKSKATINSKYLSHYINSNMFQNELWMRTIHVAFPKKINLGEIGECFLELPSKNEQTKIANFLSAIDEKIEKVTAQIEKTEQWKKGLLQQMFV